jgi:hypothetical protein
MTCKTLSRLSNRRPVIGGIHHRRSWHVRAMRALCLSLCLLALGGCEGAQSAASAPGARTTPDAAPASARPEESRMWMTVGGHRFAITLTDTVAARAFSGRLPLTLDMDDLNGNEKHARLPQALPVNASRPGTIRSGDVMLYGTDTLVVFYLTFESAYSYTRIGRVDDPASLTEALGRHAVQVTFTR